MIEKNKKKIIFGILFLLVFLNGPSVFAYTISNLNVQDKNDFVLEPGKVEIYLDPGEKATRFVSVTSRIKTPTKFKIEVEDFIGSRDADRAVILLGKDKSPYSLKDYLIPEISEFTLKFGEKIDIPVIIAPGAQVSPGGYYASILVSNEPQKEARDDNNGAGQTKTVSRIGSLMFVRVNGPVDESANIEDFRIKGDNKFFYEKGDLTFQILFNNTGSVHLVPYGTIAIKNIWGKQIDELPVDAYFALPKSLRYRDVSWQKALSVGRYTATVNLHKGFGDQVETKTIAFWIIPLRLILTVFGVVFALLCIFYFVAKNFEFKRK